MARQKLETGNKMQSKETNLVDKHGCGCEWTEINKGRVFWYKQKGKKEKKQKKKARWRG